MILAGNNEDYNDPETIMVFRPAGGTSNHGVVFFGFSDGFVQGGMNDEGLFLDGNSLDDTGWKEEEGKPSIDSEVIKRALLTCATCGDVEALFEKYNVPELRYARIPVADRTGASMVVEYAKGKTQFVKSDTWYQIATNFVISDVKGKYYPCERYRMAESMLRFSDVFDLRLMERILDATHQEDEGLTVYSNIYDLENGIFHVYNRRDFTVKVTFNLKDELAKGYHKILIPSLFKAK